jgi:diguanylate cyclase (GGDEF)-like protein
VWSTQHSQPPVGYLGALERVGGLAEVAIRRRLERQRLRQLVDYDQVTGALSRAGLASFTSGTDGGPTTYLLLDLDDFKAVNDRYGHATGDEVLRLAVKRIAAVLRSTDRFARLGGDEFLLLVAGGELDVATAVAKRITAVLDDPIAAGSVSVRVNASIGVAPYDPAATPRELTERADRAMYAAKRAGKSRWEVWTPSLDRPPDAPEDS